MPPLSLTYVISVCLSVCFVCLSYFFSLSLYYVNLLPACIILGLVGVGILGVDAAVVLDVCNICLFVCLLVCLLVCLFVSLILPLYYVNLLPACIILGLIRIGILGVDASIVLDVLEGEVHEAALAPVVAVAH
jgi:hypothetical protein